MAPSLQPCGITARARDVRPLPVCFLRAAVLAADPQLKPLAPGEPLWVACAPLQCLTLPTPHSDPFPHAPPPPPFARHLRISQLEFLDLSDNKIESFRVGTRSPAHVTPVPLALMSWAGACRRDPGVAHDPALARQPVLR